MNIQDKIDFFVNKALENRAKVLDDFCQAYLASRADFFREKPKRISRLELIIQKSSNGLEETYSFRVKHGKPRSIERK